MRLVTSLWHSPAVVPNITFPTDATLPYVVNQSSPAVFECMATGIPAPTISWLRNDALLDGPRVSLSNPSSTSVVIEGENVYEVTRTLTLADTVDSDSGTYTCQASNDGDMTSDDMQDFELVVQSESV